MARAPRDSLRLTEQLNAEWQRSGLNFRVMLVGESGLGKTTFTRALLRPFVAENMLDATPSTIRSRTTQIHEVVHNVVNDGFPVEFTIIDCPGYGDSVDSSSWIESIVNHIKGAFAAHYESVGNPPKLNAANPTNFLQRDGLIHVCLYFIAAHRLKGVDVEFIKRLEPYVNVVPVIAKSDTMTLAERDAFRRLVLGELRANNVRIFQLSEPSDAASSGGALGMSAPPSIPAPSPPSPPSEKSDAAAAAAPRAIATTQPPPFAVCASEDGTRVYPWGTCCVEDPTHSDLSTLRSMLFASSMLPAKRKTFELFEESYAAPRRAQEDMRVARLARAFQRERLVTRLVVLGLGASAVGLAARAAAERLLAPEAAQAAWRLVGTAWARAVEGASALIKRMPRLNMQVRS